jgi:2-oxoglutarate dehydrogenase E2 component (dihydrolipoamide succinyltransferase)
MTGELLAGRDGYIHYHCRAGEEVEVGRHVASVTDQVAPSFAPDAVTVPSADTLFSPAATRLLQERGIPASAFAGKDFVTTREVLALTGGTAPQSSAPVSLKSAAPPENYHLEPLPLEKRTENRLLSRAHSEVVPSRVAVRIPSDKVLARARAELRLYRRTPLPFVLAGLPAVLAEFPIFNGFHHEGAFARADALRCGLAIDLGRGLRVVSLPPLEGLPLREIEKAIFSRVDRYTRGELTRDDLAPTTFTVTDLSGEGAHSVHAVVNHRQAAILSIAGGGDEPFELGLTFDHRLASGRDAARFLGALRSSLLPSPPSASTEVPT